MDADKLLDRFPEVIDTGPDSTLRKFIETHQAESDDFVEHLNSVQSSHFIDQAEGEELDRIGAIFGPLGDRGERGDQEYRAYLKSIVQAYRGAGTVPAIKKAVAAGIGVDEGDVVIEEDFENLSYRIKLSDWNGHEGSTIEELADLADASVAQLQRTHYIIDTEELTTGDAIEITTGQQIQDLLYTSDPVGVNPNKTNVTDHGVTTDGASVNANTTTVGDGVNTGVGATVDPEKTSVSETTSGADTVFTTSRKVVWDAGEWDTMRWQ